MAYIKASMKLLAGLGVSDTVLPNGICHLDSLRYIKEAVRAKLGHLVSEYGPFPITVVMPSVGDIIYSKKKKRDNTAEQGGAYVADVVTMVSYFTVLEVEFVDQVIAIRNDAAIFLKRALGYLLKYAPIMSYDKVSAAVNEWHEQETNDDWLGGVSIEARRRLFSSRVIQADEERGGLEAFRSDCLKNRLLFSEHEIIWLLDVIDVAIYFSRHGIFKYPFDFINIGSDEPWEFENYFMVSNADNILHDFKECILTDNGPPEFATRIGNVADIQRLIDRWRYVRLLIVVLSCAPQVWEVNCK